MKKILLVLFYLSVTANAQDTLIFKNKTKLVSLVLWVGEDSIRYKKIENITGPDLYVYNKDIDLIKYKNGRVKNIDSLRLSNQYQKNISKSITATQPALNSSDSLQGIAHDNSAQIYKDGVLHAEVNYKCKGCAVGFFSLGVLLGPVAFLPALSTAFTPPLTKKLAYPSEELWKDKDYQKGYRDKVGAIKRRAIFRGTTVGVIFSVFTTTLLINILSRT